ncbi:MAG TPA: YfhO family protein, partial [Nitrolancea sp.]|nr:YfhO family protein [Nitrolancea sp.]
SYEESTQFSAEPIALLHFILPKAFGSNPTDYWGAFSNGEVWGYAGVVTLVLAALALALRPTRTRLFLSGVVLLALLYALGPFTPLQGWVYRFVPLYDLVRAPGRAFLFADFGLALLAGFGAHELSRRKDLDPRRRAVLRPALRVLLIVLAALLLFVLPLYYSLVVGASDPLNRPMIVIDGIYLLALYLGLAAALIWAVAHGRLSATSVGLVALVLVTLDLFSATASFNPVSADLTAGFRHDEAVRFLQAKQQSDGPFRIDVATAAWQPDLATLAGLYDIGGTFDPMQLKSYDTARSAVASNRDLPLYDLLGVRYLITDNQAQSPGPAFTPALRTGDGLVLWENHEALPRVWLASNVQTMNLDAARAAIRDPAFDPRAVVYLSGGNPSDVSAGGSARIVEADPDVVRVQVEADGPSELVLADVNYPGWTARIDGKTTPIATADGLFRAVAVPAGTHEIVFRFRPPLLGVSLGLSVVGGLIGLALLILGLREYRSRS